MANEGYHEPIDELSNDTRDMHRAITSLMEEPVAVDWYKQRVDACKDPDLAAILAHNRDEEKEHLARAIESSTSHRPLHNSAVPTPLCMPRPARQREYSQELPPRNSGRRELR